LKVKAAFSKLALLDAQIPYTLSRLVYTSCFSSGPQDIVYGGNVVAGGYPFDFIEKTDILLAKNILMYSVSHTKVQDP
jgi:hypothetical protein